MSKRRRYHPFRGRARWKRRACNRMLRWLLTGMAKGVRARFELLFKAGLIEPLSPPAAASEQ